jgi:hypothetical protein
MSRTILAALAAFLAGVALTLAAVFVKQDLFAHGPAAQKPVRLSAEEVERVLLYATLKDGYLEGTFFNQNPDLQVTQITVETVPKDEANPFNKFSPRLFNVVAIAKPRTMSRPFRVETGLLNPEFHTLRVVEGQGTALP